MLPAAGGKSGKKGRRVGGGLENRNNQGHRVGGASIRVAGGVENRDGLGI